MFRPFPRLLVWLSLILAFTPIYAEERVNDYLKIPPAMARQIGNPLVVMKSGDGPSFRKKVFSKQSYIVHASSREQASKVLAKGILTDFYRKNLSQSSLSINEKRLKMKELIPMTEEIFISTGTNRLMGKRASTQLLDAWWKVRMGMPLRRNYSHQLLIVNQHWERKEGKKTTWGHFCFALRKRGGDPNGDTMFDFRAPWPYDRRARFTEAPNIHNRLKLEGTTVNLYDWFHTQTQYRNCYINMWAVPIHEEQLTLLQALSDRDEKHQAGNFRVGKKNCASMGAHYLDRILPFGEGIERKVELIDLPVKTGQLTVKRFADKNISVKISNITRKLGRTPTCKSELRPAGPSRATCRSFRLLRNNPEIN